MSVDGSGAAITCPHAQSDPGRIMDEHGYKSVVCIGDGANDLEAKPPATAVIGFGGVTVRDKVAAEADWFVKSMHEIIAALDD